jgi:hypothetical protein
MQTRPALVSNPVFIPANNQEAVWERTVDVLHQYQFPVKRENKLDGVIETDYKVGAGVLEPWHRDAVGLESQLEGSLQSVRRRLSVSVTPESGGYWVGVEAFKELEDHAGRASNSAGGATFQNHTPLQRDLSLVVGQSAPSGWIALGRDPGLEQSLLRELQTTCSR